MAGYFDGGDIDQSKADFLNVDNSSQEFQPKDYSYLLGMPGFSDQLLKMHFQLYQGYVKNTNLLMKKITELSSHEQFDYDFGALKRRLGWEFDGMRLHEFYFDNLGGKEGIAASSALYRRLLKDFGSFDQWKKEFIATGMIRGIGWAVLYRDPKSGILINTWINEHDLGHLAGGDPILIMDVFEHAYMPQYGLDRKKYIDAFFDNVNWNTVYQRYNASLKK